MEKILQIKLFIVDSIGKYFPIYIDWLTEKLGTANPFGTLALVGFLTMFFLLGYIFIRNSRAQ